MEEGTTEVVRGGGKRNQVRGAGERTEPKPRFGGGRD